MLTSTEVTTPVTAEAVTTIARTATLSVSKTVDDASISAPGPLVYTITVTNTGTVGLSGVAVADAFAGGAAYVSGDTDGDNVLDLTEAWIYTADYLATQADIDRGTNLVNIVSVTSTEVTTPVTAEAVTSIARTAALSVSKTVDHCFHLRSRASGLYYYRNKYRNCRALRCCRRRCICRWSYLCLW